MPISRRLRFLRGDETQQAFAKKVGISRSALANYETGRSKPDDFTLAQISEKAGVPPDYFDPVHDPAAPSSLARSIGQYIEGVPDWTDDEATVIRVLRLCDVSTVLAVLRTISEGASRQEFVVTLGTIFTVNDDLQRLLDLAAGKRPFEKGSLSTYPEDSPMHRIGFKEQKSKGSQ